MSGSIGNVVSAMELIDRHGPDLLRYLLLSTHYRRPIEFTDDVLASAKKGLTTFQRLFERAVRLSGAPFNDDAPDMDRASGALLDTEYGTFARATLNQKMKFLELMDDDFNTASALAAVHNLVREINTTLAADQLREDDRPVVLDAIATFDAVLGIFGPEDDVALDADIEALVEERQEARRQRNFARSDEIRDLLAEKGIMLEDTKDGVRWKRK
jgi:cysteinyl-tRNA synthetase